MESVIRFFQAPDKSIFFSARVARALGTRLSQNT